MIFRAENPYLDLGIRRIFYFLLGFGSMIAALQFSPGSYPQILLLIAAVLLLVMALFYKQLFINTYIYLDHQKLVFQETLWKRIKVLWDEVVSVTFLPAELVVRRKDDSEIHISLEWLSFDKAHQIKYFIKNVLPEQKVIYQNDG